MGRWNRGTPKILKFYHKSRYGHLYLPRGYMRQLVLMCRQHGEKTIIEDKRRLLNEVDMAFRGDLKPFQIQAVETMAKKDFGTLSAPTGSGKTIMALAMMALRHQPTLVVVHTRELATQWLERISSFMNISADDVGFIGGGKKTIGRKITVAMVQSLYKCAREVSAAVGHLVVDECHRAPSRTFTEAVKVFDSKYMLGLSATPWRRDKLSKLIYWFLGDVHHEVQKSGLVAQGHLLDLEVIFRPTDFKPYSDDGRNRLIVEDIAQEVRRAMSGNAFLVISDRKQHCMALQFLLKHRHHIPAELLTGDLPMEQRKKIIAGLEQGDVRVLIATGQLIGEGFDCPNLSVLFLTTPVRFSGRVIQYLGRILRPMEGLQRGQGRA